MIEKSPLGQFWPSLSEPFRHLGTRLAEFVSPASEASSDDAAYHIKLELPGVEEDDIHVTVDDGVMTIRGEKKTAREDKGETWYFSERQYGSFSRSFRLPADADADKVSAALKDGVLEVSVPRKAIEAPSEKRIPISRG